MAMAIYLMAMAIYLMDKAIKFMAMAIKFMAMTIKFMAMALSTHKIFFATEVFDLVLSSVSLLRIFICKYVNFYLQ